MAAIKYYNTTSGQWEYVSTAGGGGTVEGFSVGTSAPASPSVDDVWIDTSQTVTNGQVGDIVMSMRTVPGTNRLFMAGGTYNKATYPALWALNTTHPAYFTASTSTTFTLADMRTRVPVGNLGAGTFDVLGETGGSETVALTEAQNGPHAHSGTTSTAGAHTHQAQGYWNSGQGTGQALSRYTVSGDPVDNTALLPAGDHAHTFNTSSSGTGAAHNNLQPYIVVNFEVVAA